MKKLLMVAGVLLALSPMAHAADGAGVAVEDAWSRAAQAGRTGAVFMTLANEGAEADRLVSVASPAAAKAELHTHLMEDGVMRMRPIAGIEVPPGAPVRLQPGGLHVMLIDLKQALQPGQTVPLTLTFEKAGAVAVEARVLPAGAMGMGHGMHHKGHDLHRKMHELHHGTPAPDGR